MAVFSNNLLFSLGRPLSPLYSLMMRFREAFYKTNLLTRHKLSIPVISIGNLTMGGTGKTPLVIHLARMLQNHGEKVAVVSRGYKGSSKQAVNLVSDGTTVFQTAREAGDEPYLIARKLPGVVVATGKKRIVPCREVINRYQCTVILLDDGFQHLAIQRDLDLVLFDVNHFAGNSRVFPGGDLREPVTALHRCDAILLTGATSHNQTRAEKCTQLLNQRFAEIPVYPVSPIYTGVLRHHFDRHDWQFEPIELSALPEQLFCFSGIAQPDRFAAQLVESGIICADHHVFADHHRYTQTDIDTLNEQADACQASGFLTTEKDVVKLAHLSHSALPIYTPILDIARHDVLESMLLTAVGYPPGGQNATDG